MSIPKNKRRKIEVDGNTYFWCTTNKIVTVFDEIAEIEINQAIENIDKNSEIKDKQNVGIVLNKGKSSHYQNVELYIETELMPKLRIKAKFDSRSIYELFSKVKGMNFISITPDIVSKIIRYSLNNFAIEKRDIEIQNASLLFKNDLISALIKLGHWVPDDKLDLPANNSD